MAVKQRAVGGSRRAATGSVSADVVALDAIAKRFFASPVSPNADTREGLRGRMNAGGAGVATDRRPGLAKADRAD
jgi:hypothetical protein